MSDEAGQANDDDRKLFIGGLAQVSVPRPIFY